MKVYLSVPLAANRDRKRASVIAEAITDSGNEVSSPWVLSPGEKHGPTAVNVFERDRQGVENSDMIIADVSHPSAGVGMEIMVAYHGGKRIVMVMKRGSVVSRMLLQMDRKETVEFDSNAELYSGLKRLLELR